MIDEVHMLTSHAFNAMLKTLEEPPAHVKFILATTDPQKIPVTVLSRCLQFNLKQMAPGHIVGHLENILAQEEIGFETPALRLLAQGAQGSMRDALSLTDQAIAYAAGTVTLDAVQGMLGALDHTLLIQMLDAIAEQDGASLLDIADQMAARSLSWNAALQDLGSLLHRIAIAQSVPSATPEDLPEREAILRLAQRFTPEDVQLYYQIAVHGRNELGLAPDEYAGFTMTLLRMLAFQPMSAGSTPPTMAAPNKIAAVAPSARSAAAPSPAVATKANPMASALAAVGSRKASAVVTVPTSAPVSVPEAPAALPAASPVLATKDTSNAVTITPPSTAPSAKAIAIDWPSVVKSLPLRGVAQQLAMQSELSAVEQVGAELHLQLKVPLQTLLSSGSLAKLSAALEEHLGQVVKLSTEIAAVQNTAHGLEVADQALRQQAAEQSVQEDPFVRALMQDFGATIVPGSVRPI
jgi:DNA polymerase-3 subunit gamma/tau